MESFDGIWHEHSRDVRRFARWLSGDPELAELLRSQPETALLATNGTDNGSHDGRRLQALARTRRLLLARSATMAVAIFVTMVPLLLTFEGDRVTFLVAGNPALMAVALTAIPLAWGIHIWLRLRLRVTGL